MTLPGTQGDVNMLRPMVDNAKEPPCHRQAFAREGHARQQAFSFEEEVSELSLVFGSAVSAAATAAALLGVGLAATSLILRSPLLPVGGD